MQTPIESTLPRHLHAIWLGGLLQEAGKKNIEAWSETNPDYTMNLWIDSSTYKNWTEKEQKNYDKSFSVIAKEILAQARYIKE